jgi:heme a synthase
LTHRTLAFLLLLHLIGVVVGLTRRPDESRTVARAAHVALGLVVLQFTVAASMVLLRLPPVLRSLHEAVGVSVWLGTFTYAYLARIAARHTREVVAETRPAARAPVGATRGDAIAMPGRSG